MIFVLGAECHCCVGVHLASGVWDGAHAGAGENVESEVAASFGPFVRLLGEDGADEAGDAIAVGEDANGVGAAANLAD